MKSLHSIKSRMHIECVSVYNESESNGLIENESTKLPHECVCVCVFGCLRNYHHIKPSTFNVAFHAYASACISQTGLAMHLLLTIIRHVCYVINRSICRIYPIFNEPTEV